MRIPAGRSGGRIGSTGWIRTLTREVDLTAVTKATLSFWSWYEVEPDFDYGYVSISTDGTHWATLKTEATTTDDPNGNNLGNGMTGDSGNGKSPAWVKQTADLGAVCGEEGPAPLRVRHRRGLELQRARDR